MSGGRSAADSDGSGASTQARISKLTFEPTYRCLLRCRMCFFWGTHSAAHTAGVIRNRRELTSTEIQKLLLPQCQACQLQTIAFAGGEILLRPDIFDIVEAFRSADISTIAESSLAVEMTDREIERFSDGCDYLWTSLDGTDATHDAIRGMRGAFARTTHNIARLLQRRGNASPRLLVNFVLQESNVADVVPLSRMLIRLGVSSFRLQLLSWNAGASVPGASHAVALLPSRAVAIDASFALEQVATARALFDEAGKSFSVFPPQADLSEELLVDWYTGQYDGSHFAGCGRLERPRIDPYGSVYVCVNGGPVLGNIQDQALSDIWSSANRSLFGEEIAKRRPAGCHTCCKQAWTSGGARL